MKFHINLFRELFTGSKIKVLKHILNSGFRMTGRELARVCNISHTMAIRILKEFETIHLVSNFKAGKSIIWTPKTDSYSYLIAKKIYAEKNNYMPLQHLKDILIKELKGKKVKKAILFGSVAKEKERYSSDIDVFILVNDQKDKKKIDKLMETLSLKCVKLYGNTLNQYVLTEKEFEARKNLKLIKNIEKGIRLI